MASTKHPQPGFNHLRAGIAVDYWKQADLPPEIDYFFLSHAHPDQMSGLNDTWPNTIFTSEITKNILHIIYPKIPPCMCSVVSFQLLMLLAANIIGLAVNATHTFNSTIGEETHSLAVTLIDARHCPGTCECVCVNSITHMQVQ